MVKCNVSPMRREVHNHRVLPNECVVEVENVGECKYLLLVYTIIHFYIIFLFTDYHPEYGYEICASSYTAWRMDECMEVLECNYYRLMKMKYWNAITIGCYQ